MKYFVVLFFILIGVLQIQASLLDTHVTFCGFCEDNELCSGEVKCIDYAIGKCIKAKNPCDGEDLLYYITITEVNNDIFTIESSINDECTGVNVVYAAQCGDCMVGFNGYVECNTLFWFWFFVALAVLCFILGLICVLFLTIYICKKRQSGKKNYTTIEN